MTTKVTIQNHGPDFVLVRTYRKDNEPGDDSWSAGNQPAAFIAAGESAVYYVHGNEGLLLDENHRTTSGSNMTPEEISSLADRIDSEELWRIPGMDQDKLTPEQQDRLWAGVYLRRHASHRTEVVEALKEGCEYIRGFKFERADNMSTDRRGCGTNEWHRALNGKGIGDQAPHWMYTAKMVSDEVPRMILLFELERRGLPTSFKACGHDPRPATPLPDNHLRCGLGKECRKCPFLARIETQTGMTNEAKDEAKAWTCATHILLESKLSTYMEGMMHDKSHAAYEQQLAYSLSVEEE